MNKIINQFAVSYNPQIPDAVIMSDRVISFLEGIGASITAVGAIHDKTLRQRVKKKEFDALIVLGGDGTMLRAECRINKRVCLSAFSLTRWRASKSWWVFSANVSKNVIVYSLIFFPKMEYLHCSFRHCR